MYGMLPDHVLHVHAGRVPVAEGRVGDAVPHEDHFDAGGFRYMAVG